LSKVTLRGEMPTDPPEAGPNSVLIGLALFDDDREAAQLVRHLAEDDAVRGVNAQVTDALDDLEFFAYGRPR
jgi:hypothetical protein